MKTFTAYRWVVNEVGRPHLSNIKIKAENLEEAQRIKELWAWIEIDESHGEIDAGPELSAKCDAYVEARNHEWLTTGQKRFVIV